VLGTLGIGAIWALVKFSMGDELFFITFAITAVFSVPFHTAIMSRRQSRAGQSIAMELSTVVMIVSLTGVFVQIDPFFRSPLYLGFVFLLHPVLGWVTTAGALFLISLTLLTERLMRKPSEASSTATRQRWSLAEASEQNAEVLNAMGFAHRFMRRFQAASHDYLAANERLSDIVGSLTVVSRVFRLMLQSARSAWAPILPSAVR